MQHVCILVLSPYITTTRNSFCNNSTDLSLLEAHRWESPYASLDYSPLPGEPPPPPPVPPLPVPTMTSASSITKTGSSSASLPLPASFVLTWNRELWSLSVGPYRYNSHLCIFFLQRTWEHTWRSQKQRRYLMLTKTEGCVMEFHACRVGESRWR